MKAIYSVAKDLNEICALKYNMEFRIAFFKSKVFNRGGNNPKRKAEELSKQCMKNWQYSFNI